MKQEVVIRVSMADHKNGRSKALKIAVSLPGVESAGLHGEEKDEIQVIGEGIDAAELTMLLRKNVGPSEILSVGPAEQEKEDEDTKNVDNQMTMMPPQFFTNHYYPSYENPVFEVGHLSSDHPVYEIDHPSYDHLVYKVDHRSYGHHVYEVDNHSYGYHATKVVPHQDPSCSIM